MLYIFRIFSFLFFPTKKWINYATGWEFGVFLFFELISKYANVITYFRRFFTYFLLLIYLEGFELNRHHTIKPITARIYKKKKNQRNCWFRLVAFLLPFPFDVFLLFFVLMSEVMKIRFLYENRIACLDYHQFFSFHRTISKHFLNLSNTKCLFGIN